MAITSCHFTFWSIRPPFE